MTDAQPNSLHQRSIRAGAWTILAYGTQQGIRLGSNLIMVRLLMPESFGLLAIVLMIPIGLALLTDLGIQPSVVRSARGEDPEFLATAWTIQILRGLIIWLLSLVAAGALIVLNTAGVIPQESIYANQSLPIILIVVAFSACIGGFDAIGIAVASRRLAFGRVVLMEFLAQISSIPVMVVWAFLSPSVWALAAGVLCAAAVRTFASHALLSPRILRIGWNREYFLEIFHFGKWLIPASGFGFFANQGDRLVMGALMASTPFSLYSIAVLWVEALKRAPERLVSTLTMPAISEVLRERPEDASRVYYRFRMVFDVGALLAFATLLFFGPMGIRVVYPDAYESVGGMVAILSISLLMTPFHLLTSLMLASGNSRSIALIAGVRGASLLLLVPIGYFWWGPLGAIFLVGINQIWGLPFLYIEARKIIRLSITREAALPLLGLMVYFPRILTTTYL